MLVCNVVRERRGRRVRPVRLARMGRRASGTGVIVLGETMAMASGETYRLTAYQTSGEQLDITGGELLIERLA